MRTRTGQGWRHRSPLPMHRRTGLFLALLLALAGCGAPPSPPRYTARQGVISEIDRETGEITLEVEPAIANREALETIHWLVNKHSEIYENGRLVPIDAMKIGDKVELIGYPDPNSRPVRYVVTLARLTRDPKELKTPELPASGG